MPVYEYRCQSCQREFEDLVRLGTPDEEVECPSCGEHQSRRLLSVVAGRSKRPDSGAASGCAPSGGFS